LDKFSPSESNHHFVMRHINRREFMQQSAKAAAVTALGSSLLSAQARPTALQFAQVPLPYAFNALEPAIDAATMEIHHGRHHAAYVKNVNDAIAAENILFGTEAEFFKNASRLSAKARNNGGGAWNHNFFFLGMKPRSGAPSGKTADALTGAFGSIDKFKEMFTQAAMTRFGSGWAWLVKDAAGKLMITSTPNQDNPLMDLAEGKGTPLLGLDVWEHAYYLKYQNKRNEYIANWWTVVNWDEVAKNL
jgi:Fe-Mn family superoxide dismutase